MKKFLPTAACALFMAAGIAQAQVVVRIGPPAAPSKPFRPAARASGMGLA